MSGPRPECGTEPRELSAFDIGCVVVGGIIGVGIFFTPQKVAAAVDTPGQVMLAWGLGGLLAVLGAIVFAELALAVPGHGGMYRYVRRAFGDIPAFLYGWSNWLIVQAGAAGIVGLLLANYLEKAIAPAGPWSAPAKVFIAAGAIAVFTALNVLGLRTGKRVQNTLTVLKVLALAGLVGVAWFAPAPAPAPTAAAVPEPSDRSTLAMLGAAILPVLFATGGWQQGSFVAGAARRPWSVAFGMLFGVAVVVLTYMSVNVAYLDLLGFEGARASSAIGADAAAAALGDIRRTGARGDRRRLRGRHPQHHLPRAAVRALRDGAGRVLPGGVRSAAPAVRDAGARGARAGRVGDRARDRGALRARRGAATVARRRR